MEEFNPENFSTVSRANTKRGTRRLGDFEIRVKASTSKVEVSQSFYGIHDLANNGMSQVNYPGMEEQAAFISIQPEDESVFMKKRAGKKALKFKNAELVLAMVRAGLLEADNNRFVYFSLEQVSQHGNRIFYKMIPVETPTLPQEDEDEDETEASESEETVEVTAQEETTEDVAPSAPEEDEDF